MQPFEEEEWFEGDASCLFNLILQTACKGCVRTVIYHFFFFVYSFFSGDLLGKLTIGYLLENVFSVDDAVLKTVVSVPSSMNGNWDFN